MEGDWIVNGDDLLLVTGANGFIGQRVVAALLARGFSRIRCLVRPTSEVSGLKRVVQPANGAGQVELMAGNLLSREFCGQAARGVSVVIHLAAGMDKSFAGSFLNTVVTTRNLLDGLVAAGSLKRFVNVSSFAVYTTLGVRRGGLLDEGCPVETQHMERRDAYCFAKVKQDELVMQYGREHKVPYVIVRPGAVYGPGTRQ